MMGARRPLECCPMNKIDTLRRFVSALMHEDSEVTPVVIHSRAIYNLSEKKRNEICALALAEELTQRLHPPYCVMYAASAVSDSVGGGPLEDDADDYVIFGPNVRTASLEKVLEAMRNDPFSQFDGQENTPEYVQRWWLDTHDSLPQVMVDEEDNDKG